MPVCYLSDTELARLNSWLAGFNRDDNRLGVAVQLCTMPWLGWIPEQLTGCPADAVARLASALGIEPDTAAELLAGYGGWQRRTRRDHRPKVLTPLGWRWSGAGERKQLNDFLLARALEHDAPGRATAAGLRLAPVRADHPAPGGCAQSARRYRRGTAPAPSLSSARTFAAPATADHPGRPARRDLDLGITRLAWLRTAATPEVLKSELDKLNFLRQHGTDRLDLSRLPARRRRMLAEVGRRSTNQALQRAGRGPSASGAAGDAGRHL